MATKSEAKTMKSIRAEVRKMNVAKYQRLINELILEGMSDTDIGHEVGSSTQAVWLWRNGRNPPKGVRASAVIRVHRQVMFLRQKGVTYADVKEQKKSLEQAYEEKKRKAA